MEDKETNTNPDWKEEQAQVRANDTTRMVDPRTAQTQLKKLSLFEKFKSAIGLEKIDVKK